MKLNRVFFLICFGIVLVFFAVVSVSEAQIGVFSKEDMIEYSPLWKGERFPDGRPKVPDEVIEKIKGIFFDDAWSIIRREGYNFLDESGFVSDFDYLPTHEIPVLVGRAVTACYVPIRPDLEEVNRQRNKSAGREGGNIGMVVNTLVENDVVVVDMFGKIDGGIFAGGNVTISMHEKGAKGLVIDGGGHDLDEVLYVPDFTTFARAFSPSHMHDVMLMGMNIPVRIGKATVFPGDIVMGSREGVLFIPAHLAEKVAEGL